MSRRWAGGRISPNGQYGKPSRSLAETSSLRFDVGRADDLAPLLGFGDEELAKFGRLTGKRCIAQIAESRFHLGAHETRIGLPVEPFDDVRAYSWGRPGQATRSPRSPARNH